MDRPIGRIMKVLVIIGALNWGFAGIVGHDLVGAIFGMPSTIANIIYILVGLSGLLLTIHYFACKKCRQCCGCCNGTCAVDPTMKPCSRCGKMGCNCGMQVDTSHNTEPMQKSMDSNMNMNSSMHSNDMHDEHGM